MCQQGNQVLCYVPVSSCDSCTGELRWDWKGVDACMADLVNTLNKYGLHTRSCCCGHGVTQGSVILQSGTEIKVKLNETVQGETKGIMKFRKKPVVIEAEQLLWSTWNEMCDFAGVGKLEENKPMGCCIGIDGKALPDGETSEEIGLLIPTLEGVMLARENDYVIKGVKGELYPCKPDIFEATYERVEE